jgi:hypothetical protein
MAIKKGKNDCGCSKPIKFSDRKGNIKRVPPKKIIQKRIIPK